MRTQGSEVRSQNVRLLGVTGTQPADHNRGFRMPVTLADGHEPFYYGVAGGCPPLGGVAELTGLAGGVAGAPPSGCGGAWNSSGRIGLRGIISSRMAAL